MNQLQSRLVTIFAEADLEDQLCVNLKEWGITDYTATEANGHRFATSIALTAKKIVCSS